MYRDTNDFMKLFLTWLGEMCFLNKLVYILKMECHNDVVYNKFQTSQQNLYCSIKIHMVMMIQVVENVSDGCGTYYFQGNLKNTVLEAIRLF